MKMKSSLLAVAIVISPLFSLAHADTLPPLGVNTDSGAAVPASFAGGTTLNGGVNFLNSVPAGIPAGLLATITPAAAHVGSQASLYLVAVAGNTAYMYTPTGFAGYKKPLSLINTVWNK